MANDLLNQLVAQVDNEVTKPRSIKRLDYIVLDGSGSMIGRWQDACDAIDTYTQGVKDAGVDTKVILATFSGGNYGTIEYNVARDQAVTLWSPLGPEPPHCPGGDTPLYDAINIAVRAAREENPDEATLVFVTDGGETSSKSTDLTQAKALLDWCRSRGWQVIFIGADFNNNSLVKQLGGGADTAIGAPTKQLSHITEELAKKRAFHAKFGTPMNWSEEDKKKFGGFLSDQSGGK